MKPKKESYFRTQSTIECCHYCVAPKRYPGCHDHCPEYQKQKAEYEARKVAYYGDRNIITGLDAQRAAAITKVEKGMWKL